MKKYTVVFAAALFLSTSFVLAQESNAQTVELGKTLVATGPNFTIAYPTEWVHDIGQRIAIAENADDLAAVTDNDDSTQPAGLSITLSSIPKSAIAKALSNDEPSLDDVLNLIAQSLKLDSSYDMSIMARRAITFSGVNANGRYGIGSLWEMDDLYLVLGLGTPDETISDGALALYQDVTASMKPFGDDPIVLVEEPALLADLGLTLPYPEEWTASAVTGGAFSGMGFFSNPDDVQLFTDSGKSEQAAVVVLSTSAEDMAGLSAVEVSANFTADMEELAIEGEFLIAGVLGYGFSGLAGGNYIYAVIMTPTDDLFTMYALNAPDRETGEAAIPTFIRMLQGIETAE